MMEKILNFLTELNCKIFGHDWYYFQNKHGKDYMRICKECWIKEQKINKVWKPIHNAKGQK